MVKTDDFILMMEDGSCATLTTTAVLMGKMVSEKAKNGGTGGKRGDLLIESVDDAVANRDVWLPGSQSDNIKCSSADFDESDESGGDQSGGLSNDSRFSMSDCRTNDRRMFTDSMDNELDDRRLRRQIANCNERRRMQSINAGFQSLRHLLPRKDGDKMSKAAILAATADFIHSLLREKDKLLEENCTVMAKKRRLDMEEDSDKAIKREEKAGPNVIECLRTIDDLQNSLHEETRLRMAYEKEMAELRCQLQLSPPSSAVAVLPPLSSPRSSTDFTSNSSCSPSAAALTNGREGLLIELVRQREQQQLFLRPTAVLPSDVQLLTSAINSLASGHPTALALQQQDNGTVFMPTSEIPSATGANTHQAMPLAGGQQPTTIFGTAHPFSVVPQQTAGRDENVTDGIGTNDSGGTAATISQQNLQALVLAIRHLEGSSANLSSSPIQKGPPSIVSSSSLAAAAVDNNLMLFHQ